jgi:WD40-like Beta Propeller Repeat
VVVAVREESIVDAGRRRVARPEHAQRTAIVSVVVAGLIGALVLVDLRATDPAGDDTAAATSTTERRRSPRTTRTTAAAPPVTLPGATGLRVVLFNLVSIRVTDLDTGQQTTITEVPIGDAIPDLVAGVARGRGLVAVNQSQQVLYLPDLVANPTIVDLGEGHSVVASDRADRVWIVVGDPWTGESMAAREVDLSGRVTAGPITLPPGVSIVGPVPGGLVVGSRDGIFLVGRDGQARRIARGTPIGTFGTSVVHHACDANLRCDLHITEVATGEQRRVEGAGEIPGFDPRSTRVSPDGRFIAWLSFSNDSPEATLNLYDVTTGRTLSPLEPGPGGGPISMAWSPDGQWLFVSGISSGGSRRALRVDDGAVFELDLPLVDGAMVVTGDSVDTG